MEQRDAGQDTGSNREEPKVCEKSESDSVNVSLPRLFLRPKVGGERDYERRFGYYYNIREWLPPETKIVWSGMEDNFAKVCKGEFVSDEKKKEWKVVVNLWPAIKWLYRKVTGKKLKDE